VKLITRLIRLIKINYIIVRFNLDEIFLNKQRFFFLHFLVYLNPWYWVLRNKLTRGERIRLALEQLGPIFVKIGQILSTRLDLIPEDIALELALLQDRVPPFPGILAKAIIEQALKAPVETIFAEFDSDALASASIAQVHPAKLLDGQDVVIKVLRPNIKKLIDQDMDLLLYLAEMAERYLENARQFKPREMVNEIAQTLYDELDLLREGANASQLRRNFKNSNLLYIPKIYWSYSHPNILVMERIQGIPINNIAELRRAGVNLTKLAERGVEIFFTQVFRDSFFHADLHPGNLFVCPKDPENPKFLAVDFGIVGSLNNKDQRYIAENMLAFFKRDYQKVAELHIACGWLAPDTRIDQFEGAIRSVSEPIFEKPLKDISFGQLLLRLFQVARRFHMNLQPQLILLQKSLLSIEALSRQLSPELDLWSTASPHIERWLKKQIGVRSFFKRIRENLPLWSEQLPELPSLAYEVLNESKQRQERERFQEYQADKIQKIQSKNIAERYLLLGTCFSLVIISIAIIIHPVFDKTFAITLATIAIVTLIMAGLI
jgi:ubiquinone biosynthesis protein